LVEFAGAAGTLLLPDSPEKDSIAGGLEGSAVRVEEGLVVQRPAGLRFVFRLLRGEKVAEAAHLRVGRRGERAAERFLKKKRYRILARRLRVGRDEIDLLAKDGETLVFVEVKTRSAETFGRPIEAVGRKKRRNLSRAAVRYLKHARPKPNYVRFDVVEVVGAPDERPKIRHVENVFPIDPVYRLRW